MVHLLWINGRSCDAWKGGARESTAGKGVFSERVTVHLDTKCLCGRVLKSMGSVDTRAHLLESSNVDTRSIKRIGIVHVYLEAYLIMFSQAVTRKPITITIKLYI